MDTDRVDVSEEKAHSAMDADQADVIEKQRTRLSENFTRHIVEALTWLVTYQ